MLKSNQHEKQNAALSAKRTSKKLFRNFFTYAGAWVIMTILMLFLLLACALIPKSAIISNLKSSSDYMTERAVFFPINKNDNASIADRYADSIWLNITYGYDNKAPLSSVMRAAYYHNDTENENTNLRNAVYQNLTPNLNYTRYWHGTTAIIRPLLVILPVQKIYILNAVILILLIVLMLITIKHYLGKGVLFCLLPALTAVSIWYVPYSIEYVPCFFIMCISSIAVLTLGKKGITAASMLFFLTGGFTAYFDFLTTETITLLMPLILLLIYKYNLMEIQNMKDGFRLMFKCCVLWLAGYAVTWLTKWTLASIILKENAFASAFSGATNRISGSVSDMNLYELCISALLRNLMCIFPFSLISKNGFLYVLLSLSFILIFYYFFKRSSAKCAINKLLLLPALLPYIRFIVLSNHSYLHYFFTYRAQLISIFCLCLMLYYGIDTDYIKKKIKNRRHSKRRTRKQLKHL